ncbi:MAG TPA: uroporphyrinogen-III synthase [Acidimicrobiales bacterium]|nr:uroporphyrinogen-III synthase [Acidimicrobiales bacterium]
MTEIEGDPRPKEHPLSSWRVVVTRPLRQSAGLVAALTARGAQVVAMPTITIDAASDGGDALREAAARVDEFEWVVFTSENAVERFFAEVEGAGAFDGVRVAAIGPGTAEALSHLGVAASLVPARFVGESLVEAFPPPEANGRVLLPRSAQARDVVPEGLRKLGFVVDVVEAYRTTPALPSAAARAAAKSADAITFTSSSTVTGYLAFSAAGDLPPIVATIGPVTTATARSLGVPVDVEAAVHSSEGLVEALCRFADVNARPSQGRSRRS